MREFTESEKEFIKRIVSIHKEKGINSIPELQVAKLLHEDLKFFAIKWETTPVPQITIYIPKSKTLSEKQVEILYFQISNYIYFIEELTQLGFIKLQNIPSEKKEKFTILYDRDKYEYIAENNTFLQDMPKLKVGDSEYHAKGVISLEGWQTFHSDFALDLEKCGLAVIYPLPLACSYVDNGFKTDEQLSIESQLSDTKASLKWTKRTFGITVGALIATLAIARFGHQTINETQLSNLVDSIGSKIERAHLNEPINISTSDTISVKVVNKSPKLK